MFDFPITDVPSSWNQNKRPRRNVNTCLIATTGLKGFAWWCVKVNLNNCLSYYFIMNDLWIWCSLEGNKSAKVTENKHRTLPAKQTLKIRKISIQILVIVYRTDLFVIH